MNTGRLRSRVSLLKRQVTKDSYGESVEAFSEFAHRWAEVKDVSGREFYSKIGEESEITTRILMRLDSTVASLSRNDRVVCNGKTYHVEVVLEPDYKSRWAEILCKKDERKI